MKQLIKRIVKKGISWYIDPLCRENEKLKEELQELYAMLSEFAEEGTAAFQSVHGGTFVHNIIPPDGTQIWIYRILGHTGRLAARYIKECTGAKLAGLGKIEGIYSWCDIFG